MSDEESAVIADLERALRSPGVDDAYDQLTGSFSGRLLNADLARNLSRFYRNKYDRIAYTACTYAPCARYVLERYHRVLTEPGLPGERTVLFLAGGAASGKTSSVGLTTLGMYDLVFDSNLADFDKARRMIESALASGWQVDVNYIHRPFDFAVRSMLERAIDDGRYIPVGKLAQLHFAAQRTVLKVHEAFADDLVAVTAYANLWQPERPVDALPISLKELDEGGPYHYHSMRDLHAVEHEILEEFKASHRLEAGLLEALCEAEGGA